MQVCHLLVPADCVHVSVQTFACGKTILVESHPFPFCQGVNHLGVFFGFQNVCLLYTSDVYNFILGAVLVASLIAFAYLEKRKKIASRNMAIKNLNDSMDKAEEETPVPAVKS